MALKPDGRDATGSEAGDNGWSHVDPMVPVSNAESRNGAGLRLQGLTAYHDRGAVRTSAYRRALVETKDGDGRGAKGLPSHLKLCCDG